MNVALYRHHFFDSDGEENRNPDDSPPTRRRRVYKPRINFQLYPADGQQRFRLTTDHVELLVHHIGTFIKHDSDKNHALSPSQQIMLSLRFLATGDNFRTVADAHGVHKATLSRTVHRFVKAVNEHIYPDVVDWPSSSAQIRGIANGFMKRGMPCVFECVDGSHIQIVAPSKDEPQFVSRHGVHSINAMFVCGPKLKFYYVLSKWPGAVGDPRVFRNSNLKARLENGWRPLEFGVLLGDSAYADCDYLVTPVRNVVTARERRYNTAHRRTRSVIECAIGVLKQRFRCLLRVLHLQPVFAAEVIRCCVALHNLITPDDEADDALNEFDRNRNWEDDHDYDAGAINVPTRIDSNAFLQGVGFGEVSHVQLYKLVLF